MLAFVGEPGAEHRETIATATAAAAAGGVTTILARPDTNPPIDDPAVVDFLKRRARDTGSVRVLPMAALTRAREGREIAEFGLLLEAGAVAFGDAGHSLRNAQVMRRALSYARDFGALIVHFAEERDLAEGVMNEGAYAARLGLVGVPKAAETVMLERDVRLAALTGARYHAASVTCAESLEVLRRAKENGATLTASCSINHITLNETDVGSYRTFCKVSPPLRAEEDRKALVAALASGLVDVLMSDHDPQDVETKRLPFAEAAPGAIGIETMLSAGLRLVHAKEITLAQLLAALSTRPADLLGLPGGSLRPGSAADVIVIDTDAPWTVDPDDLKSKCKNTPFDEANLHGRVACTIVTGRTVYELV